MVSFAFEMHDPRRYRKFAAGAQPEYLHPAYASSVKRAPTKPLILLPHTKTETTGPVFGHSLVSAADSDLTAQHSGEPLGERIIVSGRVLDEDGRGVPGSLVEIWQANAAGHYRHKVDQHGAPLDPNFSGCGRVITDAEGRYRFVSIKPVLTRGAIITMPGGRSTFIFRFRSGPADAPGHANVFSRRPTAGV